MPLVIADLLFVDAQVILLPTASLRFDGALNVYIATFPQMNFILTSCSPVMSMEKAYYGRVLCCRYHELPD